MAASDKSWPSLVAASQGAESGVLWVLAARHPRDNRGRLLVRSAEPAAGDKWTWSWQATPMGIEQRRTCRDAWWLWWWQRVVSLRCGKWREAFGSRTQRVQVGSPC